LENVYVRPPNQEERTTGAEPLTQFGRMCAKLGIIIAIAGCRWTELAAPSPNPVAPTARAAVASAPTSAGRLRRQSADHPWQHGNHAVPILGSQRRWWRIANCLQNIDCHIHVPTR